jgi:hypothetical protein
MFNRQTLGQRINQLEREGVGVSTFEEEEHDHVFVCHLNGNVEREMAETVGLVGIGTVVEHLFDEARMVFGHSSGEI